MAFYTLDPALLQQLLQGETDVLTDAQRARIDKIKRTPCPRCGASLHPELRSDQPFQPDDPLPRMWMHCECGYRADAQTGLIVDRGSATKVKDPFPLIQAKD